MRGTHFAWTRFWSGMCEFVDCHAVVGRWALGDGVETLDGKDGIWIVVVNAGRTIERDYWEGVWGCCR